MGLDKGKRVKADLFKKIAGSELVFVERYLSGEWEWGDLWDYNFENVDASSISCKCKFEALKGPGKESKYPLSIADLEKKGLCFTLTSGGGSWYVDAYYKCTCGQVWKEVFLEAMQYIGNYAYPIDDDGRESW